MKGLSEAQIQSACVELMALDGWRHFKMEPISRREWGKGTGELGMPDSLFIRYGKWQGWMPATEAQSLVMTQLMFVEWKKRGGKAAQHQLDWHAKERARGALVLLAGVDFPASVEGFWKFYEASGLMRTKISLGKKG